MDIINVATPDSSLGDLLRNAFVKCNANFAELESLIAGLASQVDLDAAIAALDASIADIYAILATKSDVGHTHIIANIIGLQTALNSLTPISNFNSAIASINLLLTQLNLDINELEEQVDIKLQKKQNLPTGFISGLTISINSVDNTKFDIAAGIYTVTDFSDIANVDVEIYQISTITGITPTYLNTNIASYIAIDANQNIVQSSSPFDNDDRRTLAIIGAVIHSNLTTINAVNEIKAPIIAPTNQLHDLMKAVGFLNLNGNVFSANGANLLLNKSAGQIFGLGINPHDYNDPHRLTLSGLTGLTFRYRLQNGTEGSNVTAIDPTHYDLNNTLTLITQNNKWTIQHINIFQSGLVRIQYGQNLYSSFSDAQGSVFTENFSVEQNIAENGVFRAYLIIKKTTTNLTADIASGDAAIISVDKFGNAVGGPGNALTSAAIIAALGYTPEDVANKVTSLDTPNNTTYPTTLAVATAISGITGGISGSVSDTQVPYGTGVDTVASSSRFTWNNTTSELGVNGNTFNIKLKENLNNKYLNIHNNGFGNADFMITNSVGRNLLLLRNPEGLGNTASQLAIGNVTSIPSESQLYVFGGQNGANIDMRGAAYADEANMDFEGADWTTTPNSIGVSYYGSQFSGVTTTLGYPNNKTGILRWQEANYAIIKSDLESGMTPIMFGINNIEIGQVNDKGFEYKSDFASGNTGNQRWIVDKGYVDNGLTLKVDTASIRMESITITPDDVEDTWLINHLLGSTPIVVGSVTSDANTNYITFSANATKIIINFPEGPPASGFGDIIVSYFAKI